YAHLLAAARLNWQQHNDDPQEVFGCYTIADSWTFLRAEVHQLDSEKPTLWIEFSREYVEKLEAPRILQILRHIVSRPMSLT
ncbi:MAG: hypothetical protein F6K30_18085, partial [Cyanothece sp. SIO2G6]|nr:hypothetical protein [Cyanothece sp. SIO2G6]